MRKIVYVGLIALLVFPLMLIARPSSIGRHENEGGKLARLRTEHGLSRANLMEIDPASETMKLATLGMRGVAVNILWMQATEQRKVEDWDGLAATLQALIKVQPNFVKVWEFQAHNLSYNISMEFDDYEYRYHWVKKGISFLKEGVPYNRTDHRMFDHLGFFTGMKLGKSDEKVQFRRMFREDNTFHEEMADQIDPAFYYEGEDYGYDSWRMAYNWHQLSRELVGKPNVQQQTGDVLYFSKRPAQLRNEGKSLNEEFRSTPYIQEIWQQSRDEWIEYGRRPVTNTLNTTITLEGMVGFQNELERLREQLDEFAPGVRNQLIEETMDQLEFTEEEKQILALPMSERNDEQTVIASRLNLRLFKEDRTVDGRVLKEIPKENELEALRIIEDIAEVSAQIRSIEQQEGVANYRYWRVRTECESDEITLRARRALHDAQQVAARSMFDDEYIFNRKTSERIVTSEGAISLYEKAFVLWDEVFEKYPLMKTGDLGDQIVREIGTYYGMLEISSIEWKDEFPLQGLIDFRKEDGERDNLPTSEYLNRRDADREEELEESAEKKSIDGAGHRLPGAERDGRRPGFDGIESEKNETPDDEDSGDDVPGNESPGDDGAGDDGAGDDRPQ